MIIDVLATIGGLDLLILVCLIIYGIIRLKELLRAVKAARGLFAMYKMMQHPPRRQKAATLQDKEGQ
jgi:hypothetical protein